MGLGSRRLCRRDGAIAAYSRLLEQEKVPVEPLLAGQLQSQIKLVAAAADVAKVPPMRNPWME